MWVLQKTDDPRRGAYVARPGSERSYTTKLEHAQIFLTRELAAKAACVDNEVPRHVPTLLGQGWPTP